MRRPGRQRAIPPEVVPVLDQPLLYEPPSGLHPQLEKRGHEANWPFDCFRFGQHNEGCESHLSRELTRNLNFPPKESIFSASRAESRAARRRSRAPNWGPSFRAPFDSVCCRHRNKRLRGRHCGLASASYGKGPPTRPTPRGVVSTSVAGVGSTTSRLHAAGGAGVESITFVCWRIPDTYAGITAQAPNKTQTGKEDLFG